MQATTATLSRLGWGPFFNVFESTALKRALASRLLSHSRFCRPLKLKRQEISLKLSKNVIDYIFKFTSFLDLFTI